MIRRVFSKHKLPTNGANKDHPAEGTQPQPPPAAAPAATPEPAQTPAPPPPPPPPPPPAFDVWQTTTGGDNNNHTNNVVNVKTHYVVRHPWQWVMHEIATPGMVEVSSASELPLSQQAAAAAQSVAAASAAASNTPSTPATRRRRNQKKSNKNSLPATFRLNICTTSNSNDSSSNNDKVELAIHGTSSAIDGLEDKDELFRTLQRCRCDQLNLSPPSILVSWDVTKEECLNVVGKELPAVEANTSRNKVAVLKEPMGSQGKGIYFVKTAEEIFSIIDDQHQRAMKEPQFLDNLIEAKGRIPSWVLQAEVVPALLVKGGRKFHIRSYVVVIERPFDEEVLDMYIYNRHEVRIAGVAVDSSDVTGERNRMAHITNGALCETTERTLLHLVPELVERNLQEKLEIFIAKVFAKHLFPDIHRRVQLSASQAEDVVQPPNSSSAPPPRVREFALAGIDLMVTNDDRIYLLEVNNNPSAPPKKWSDDVFTEHLTGFLRDLINLVAGQRTPNFMDAFAILEQNGLLD